MLQSGVNKGFSPLKVGLVLAIGLGICLLTLMWPSTKNSSADQAPLPEQAIADQSMAGQSLSTQIPVADGLDTAAVADEANNSQAQEKIAKLDETASQVGSPVEK